MNSEEEEKLKRGEILRNRGANEGEASRGKPAPAAIKDEEGGTGDLGAMGRSSKDL